MRIEKYQIFSELLKHGLVSFEYKDTVRVSPLKEVWTEYILYCVISCGFIGSEACDITLDIASELYINGIEGILLYEEIRRMIKQKFREKLYQLEAKQK